MNLIIVFKNLRICILHIPQMFNFLTFYKLMEKVLCFFERQLVWRTWNLYFGCHLSPGFTYRYTHPRGIMYLAENCTLLMSMENVLFTVYVRVWFLSPVMVKNRLLSLNIKSCSCFSWNSSLIKILNIYSLQLVLQCYYILICWKTIN